MVLVLQDPVLLFSYLIIYCIVAGYGFAGVMYYIVVGYDV